MKKILVNIWAYDYHAKFEVKSEDSNGIVRYEDIGWCEPCWERKTNQQYFTAGEIYDTYQLDNDIKQMKEDQVE